MNNTMNNEFLNDYIYFIYFKFYVRLIKIIKKKKIILNFFYLSKKKKKKF